MKDGPQTNQITTISSGGNAVSPSLLGVERIAAAVDGQKTKGITTTSSGVSVVSPKVVKREFTPEGPVNERMKNEIVGIFCDVKHEEGTLTALRDDTSDCKETIVSDLVVKIKSGNEEPNSLTHKLVGCLPGQHYQEDQKHLLAVRYEEKRGNYSDDETGVYFGDGPRVSVDEQLINDKTDKIFLKECQIHCDVKYKEGTLTLQRDDVSDCKKMVTSDLVVRMKSKSKESSTVTHKLVRCLPDQHFSKDQKPLSAIRHEESKRENYSDDETGVYFDDGHPVTMDEQSNNDKTDEISLNECQTHCDVERVEGMFTALRNDTLDCKKRIVSDLVVRVKSKNEESSAIAHKLVRCLPDQHFSKDQKPLLAVRHEEKRENYSEDETGINFEHDPSVTVSEQSNNDETDEIFLNKCQTHCDMKRVEGMFTALKNETLDCKKRIVSDLVVRIKSKNEESSAITHKLVQCLPDQHYSKDQKPLLAIRHEETKRENHSDNETGVHFGDDQCVTMDEQSNNDETNEISSNECQTQSNVCHDSRSIKLVRVTVRLDDLFSRNLRTQGRAHSNTGLCRCIYCRGEFRYKVNLPERLENHKNKKSSDSAVEIQQRQDRPFKCNRCPADFKLKRNLRLHAKVHSSDKPFACNECPKKFKWKHTLQGHLKLHRSEGPFECGECCAKFPELNRLKAHLKIHNSKRPFKCTVCFRTFSRQSLLTEHSKVHSDERPFKCNQCPEAFKRSSNLWAHSRSHSDERPFECKHCPAKFKLKHCLTIHLKRHKVNKPFKCSKCPQKFKELKSLTRHLGSYHDEKPYKCTACPKTFKDPTTLKIHRSVHSDERPFKCSLCPKAFKHSSALKGHIELHSLQRPFKCEQCPAKFKRLSNLRAHSRIHSAEKPYKCTECLKTFAQQASLTSHMLKHTGERSFKCNLCPRTYPTQGALTYHLTTHGERSFACDQCLAKFKSQFSLNVHLKRHTSERRFECAECGKKFKDMAGLKLHSKTPSKEPKYKCAHCPFSSTSKVPLRVHMKVHGDEKPCKCDWCPARYKFPFALRNHVRIHTGEKPFVCNQCPAKFGWAGPLKLHQMMHRGEKPFECNKCLKKFRNKGAFHRHFKSMHSGKQLFECNQCPAKLKSQNKLDRHLMAHSNKRLFACAHCSLEFKLKKSVIRHLKKNCSAPSIVVVDS